MTTVEDRLEYLRGEIRSEQISYGEIAELQSLAAHIDPGDVELLEWAGVPEFPETHCGVCRFPLDSQSECVYAQMDETMGVDHRTGELLATTQRSKPK